MGNLQRSNASAWRKKTELVSMPSGLVAELQRLNLVTMLAKSDVGVPNFLVVQVNNMVNGVQSSKVLTDDTVADARGSLEAIIWLAKSAFVYPVLVDGEPENDDEVCIDHIEIADLSFAASYGSGDATVVKDIERFLSEQKTAVESVSAGENVADEAE